MFSALMNPRFRPVLSWLNVILLLALLGGCATDTEQKQYGAMRKQARAEHEFYRSLPLWKKNIYKNKELLDKASPENTSIEISLADQRGVILVHGGVAMDFPVATGKASHPTPTGQFTIIDMKKDYSSNLYGRIYDAAGTAIVTDADSRTDKVPEGGRFVGAQMPYWMRLTNSGVGMHVGYVPGRPASHGCIRLRSQDAKEIFALVRLGTPVEIVSGQLPSLTVATKR